MFQTSDSPYAYKGFLKSYQGLCLWPEITMNHYYIHYNTATVLDTM